MLLDEIRNVVKDEKIADEVLITPTYSTGFDILDYRNGRISDNKIEKGFDAGKIVTFIGKSGSGKTTLAIQTAINIVKDFEEGQIIHMDYERATNPARIQALSGWSSSEMKNKYMLLNSSLSAESLYSLVKGIAKTKLNPDNYDKIKIETGQVDNFGKEIFVLPPTVVIVDSWALLTPKDIADEKELSGSMSASAIAKTNNAIIKRLIGPLEQANIILLIVNHITQKIEIGFTKTQAQINYLKQDESIPGGTSCIFLANNIIKITTSTKLDESEKFGIKGFMTVVEYLKSRSNESGRKFELVFSQSDGFDNLLSNLNMVMENKLLRGNGRAYYIDGCEDVKFTLKTFKDKYEENEKLRKAFDRLVKDLLIDCIPKNSNVELEEENYEEEAVTEESDEDDEVYLEECVDEENDIWKGSDGLYYTGEGEEIDYKPAKKRKK